MKNTFFCIAKDRLQVESVVEQLKLAGFMNADISVLFPDASGTCDFAHKHNTSLPGGVTADPNRASLSRATMNKTSSVLMDALAGMEISEYEAKRYVWKISGGSILISVHTHDAQRGKIVMHIYERSGAKDIQSTSETTVPSEWHSMRQQTGSSLRA